MSFAKIGTLVVALWCGSIAPAVASPPSDVAINGTYTAFSDGDWAKKNQVYYNELPVMSTWTVTSTCRTFMDCTGQVTTSQGWTGELKYRAGQWVVFHTVEGWVKCVAPQRSPVSNTSRSGWIRPIRHNLSAWTRLSAPPAAPAASTVG